jgi:DNA repair/transcription protein MET18/MMS19
MDGEKDPRNLLLCFKIAATIVRTIPEFVRFDEDLFEVTSCYFPISFQEKPGDPEAISKKDLVEGIA